MSTYFYPKQVERTDELLLEIQNSTVGQKAAHIVGTESGITISTTSDLTTSNETVLNDLVNNFSDVAQSLKVPKILRLAKEEAKQKHFHNIIYTSNKELENSLYPKRTTIQGEVIKVEWYEACTYIVYMGMTIPQFSGLVIRVDIVYNRDSSGFAIDRNVVRTYINEDDTDNPETKTSHKTYYSNNDSQIKEGIKRRGQLVISIQKPVLEAMVEVLMPTVQNQTLILLQGREFMTDYHHDFSKFVDESASNTDITDPDFNKKLVVIRLEQESRTDRIAWLDAAAPARLGGSLTIREYLVNEFDI